MEIVRNSEEAAALELPPLLILDPLESFFDQRGLGSGPIEATRIGEGHSNITFLIERGDQSWVLRRPPRPPFHPSAHDVLREYQLLSALENSKVPLPKTICACDEEAVLDVPFYVMEALEGHVFQSTLDDRFRQPEQCRLICEQLVDTLVEIHAAPYEELGLGEFGSSENYLDRQLHRFSGIWEKVKTREVEEVEQAREWLVKNKPSSPPSTIAHGDYRLGNVMFAPEPPADLIAVFDWELATIGDPLADLGYLTATWTEADDPPIMSTLGAVTQTPGFMTRDEIAKRYAERSGRSIETLPWYQVLALWRAAVFLESNYSRLLAGTADDPWYKMLGDGIPLLAAHALSFAE